MSKKKVLETKSSTLCKIQFKLDRHKASLKNRFKNVKLSVQSLQAKNEKRTAKHSYRSPKPPFHLVEFQIAGILYNTQISPTNKSTLNNNKQKKKIIFVFNEKKLDMQQKETLNNTYILLPVLCCSA